MTYKLSTKDSADPPVRDGSRPVILLTTSGDTDETVGLIAAAGFKVAHVVRQVRARPDPGTYLGRGKLEEVRVLLRGGRPPLVSPGDALVVANDSLKPPTLFNLEDELKAEVWDRIRLILEIFQRNARIKEAQLQVELARLRYELPFVHEALHRQLTGEHPGFMGGGEVEARTYETHLKRRTRTILKELERIKKERGTRRAGRRRGGLRQIAIAGYTNSGKSSLLNELTGSSVTSADQLFTTLQTTTRRLRPDFVPVRPPDLLFTDTVGFIRNLPPWLIDAFASTLEETTESDAVLLVIDGSEPLDLVEEKVRTALQILERIHAPRRVLALLNKADLVTQDERQRLLARLQSDALPPRIPFLFTSLRSREGLDELVTLLREHLLESRLATLEVDTTNSMHLQFESWLRDRAQVLTTRDLDAKRGLRIRCGIESWGLLLSRAKRAGVPIHPDRSTGKEGGSP